MDINLRTDRSRDAFLRKLEGKVRKRLVKLLRDWMKEVPNLKRPGIAYNTPESDNWGEVAANLVYPLRELKAISLTSKKLDKAMQNTVAIEMARQAISKTGEGFRFFSKVHVLPADDPGSYNFDDQEESRPPSIGWVIYCEISK